VPLDRAVELSTKELDSSLRMNAVGKDISLGGMFIQTNVAVRFGEHLVVYFTCPVESAKWRFQRSSAEGRRTASGCRSDRSGAHDTHAIVAYMGQRS
jgi:hypothetical protein